MVAYLAATENYYYFGKKETSFKTNLEQATTLGVRTHSDMTKAIKARLENV